MAIGLLLMCGTGTFADSWAHGAARYRAHSDWTGLAGYSRRWIQAQPNDPASWLALGEAYGHLQQWQPMAQTIHRAAALMPRDPRPFEEMSGYFAQARYFADAILALEEAVRAAPNQASTWLALAAQLGNLTEQQIFQPRQVVRGNGGSPQQNAQAADGAFRRAIALGAPEPWGLLARAAVLYMEADVYAPAVRAYLDAVRLHPQEHSALQGLASADGFLKGQCIANRLRFGMDPRTEVEESRWRCGHDTYELSRRADALLFGRVPLRNPPRPSTGPG